jgi:hypothetical protein
MDDGISQPDYTDLSDSPVVLEGCAHVIGAHTFECALYEAPAGQRSMT